MSLSETEQNDYHAAIRVTCSMTDPCRGGSMGPLFERAVELLVSC